MTKKLVFEFECNNTIKDTDLEFDIRHSFINSAQIVGIKRRIDLENNVGKHRPILVNSENVIATLKDLQFAVKRDYIGTCNEVDTYDIALYYRGNHKPFFLAFINLSDRNKFFVMLLDALVN